jgi:lipopolysaccharide transport system ATP-binding protein
MGSVIEITNLSKIYRLGEIGTGTISHDLERWYKMRIRGQEDPFLKIGETNVGNKKGVSDVVYSLRDINFEVQQGDALGIIGKNGAGKSTLLKIISRVTSPSTGKINIKGRIASLLEVGTGFHPELTGRENIYLNGAILGMRKKEIIRKLDEIIDFSGVERYIDTPVKRYSSGMYVRLAFAVAAHLESEILIVDEVLAVGDAEFQKKCLGKMGEVSKGEGRTVLFVSHNMGAISTLCQKTILLNNGELMNMGETSHIIEKYLNIGNIDSGEILWKDGLGDELIRLFAARILNFRNEVSNNIDEQKHFFLELEYKLLVDTSEVRISITIITSMGIIVFTSTDNDDDQKRVKGEGRFIAKIKLPSDFFNYGTYSITIAGHIPHRKLCFMVENCLSFNIENTGGIGATNLGRLGILKPLIDWDCQNIM